MKKLYFFIPLFLCCYFLQAQTWTGAINTDWNNASNWNPAGVPGTSGNVIIPPSLGNYPVMNGKVTINSIEMQPGSRLDLNGSELALNGVNANINFSGAILNNSNGATDIVLTINTGTGGFLTYFTSNTINDNIIFNLSGGNNFVEATGAPNIYNGHATFNINDILQVHTSYSAPSQYNGNLTINRTAAGTTLLFYYGAVITGNFSYTSNPGSPTVMGNPAYKTSIGGTVNISAIYTVPAVFEMYRLINQTSGGTVNVVNPEGFTIQQDTLKLGSLNITGYRGNTYARLLNNEITGNVTLADDATYGGGFITYIRNNQITGNSDFTINGSNSLLEGDQAGTGNHYFGNVNFNSAGGPLYISQGDSFNCSGNLTINRTAAGPTIAIYAGGQIGGNFTYTNNVGGYTTLGSLANSTVIAGTINIQAVYSTPGLMLLKRFINQSNGGSIDIQNSFGFNLERDTLLVNSLSITGYTGDQYGYLLYNDITGNITLSSASDYSNGYSTYIRNNKITGNSQFTASGMNAFYEADAPGTRNYYTGNVIFNAAGGGEVFISHLDSLYCSGNLSINRTAAGNTYAFYGGGRINGHFTYTNNAGGATVLGNQGFRTSIAGKTDITAGNTVPGVFKLYRLVNNTGGGLITVTNSIGFDIVRDTLIINTLSVTGYSGNDYGRLMYNDITGNITLSSASDYSAGFVTYIYNNKITGNSQFNPSGMNSFNEADFPGTGNYYTGNVAVNINGTGNVYFAHGDTSHCTGNLSINRTVAGYTHLFNAGAGIDGNFTYTNLTGGAAVMGHIDRKTTIGGMVNINTVYGSPAIFRLYRIRNLTGGGSINVQQSAGFDVLNDTLLLSTLDITGYTGNEYARLLNNHITGNVTLADDATYGGGFITYIRNNIIEGNSSFTNNGSNNLFDADQPGTGNKYLGHLRYTRVNSSILAATGAVNEVSGNLVLSSSSNIFLGKFRFIGGTNSVVEQQSTEPIIIGELLMEKTGTGSLTLNDTVSIQTSVTFTSGLINSSAGKELIFLYNAVHTGASDISFVNGPVKKSGDKAFLFPVGKVNKLALIGITAPSQPTDEFRAEYFLSPAHNSGYDSTLKDPTIHHISSNEFWLLNRTAGSSGVTVTLTWVTSRSGVVNNIPDLRVARWNGAMWKDEGNGGTSGTNAAGTILTAAAVTSFSPFTLASSTFLNPLPVHFVMFTAIRRDDNTVWLQWKTEQEMNTDFYEVQKSTDRAGWTSIARISSNGSGSYEYTDQSVNGSISYYRIRQVSEDGRFTYSIIIPVRRKTSDLLQVWPNPASDYVYVQTPEANGIIEVTDLNGRIMNRIVINNTIMTIPVQSLAQGIYFIRVRQQQETTTVKFLKH